MPVLKCTMCGGDLDINSEMTVGVCQYCGSTLTIPKHLDKLGNLYNRANALRQNNEFDKAIIAYEDILKEDFSDSDAHWGLLLCKYGIEYVEDPNTGDRVPTCHRLQYDSILMDSDYQAAINNADSSAKVVFEAEARRIDRIQKRILEISSKEDPFDVFICYKETDETGNRSEDSVIAQEMYYELTKRGFKVFYARKTLEGKLGNAYEPVIFAALNSAKAMVVLGTKADNFSSVWVKNEWSRYRELIKKGQEKTLIPAYRGFSAYELPVEFSNLQALDMSKLGFMHDLMDGLEKIVGRLKNPQVANSSKESSALAQNNNNIQPLLDRAYLCLEDGEFDKADELLEQVLNIDPRSAVAYIAKLMVELKVNHENELANGQNPLTHYNNYQKAVRFADDEKKELYLGYNSAILANIEAEKVAALNQKLEEEERVKQQLENLLEKRRQQLIITRNQVVKTLATEKAKSGGDGFGRGLLNAITGKQSVDQKYYEIGLDKLFNQDYIYAQAIMEALGHYKDSSSYAIWIKALRHWGKDPAVSGQDYDLDLILPLIHRMLRGDWKGPSHLRLSIYENGNQLMIKVIQYKGQDLIKDVVEQEYDLTIDSNSISYANNQVTIVNGILKDSLYGAFTQVELDSIDS